MTRALALLYLALLAHNAAYAIDPNRAVSQYVRHRWGFEQGFPRGAVYAITQTADGFLWIGTDAGLVRFDGLHFTLVTDPSGAVNVERVLGLSPDREGNLWIRLPGPTLVRYRAGAFERAPLESQYEHTTATTISNEGALLTSAAYYGVLRYGKGRFEFVAPADPSVRSPIISMAQTPDGDIWMGTRDSGIFRIQKKKTFAVVTGLPDPKVNALLPGRGRDLWIGTDGGLVRWNGAELTSDGIPPGLANLQVLAIARDRDENLWVGTNSTGLLRIKGTEVSALSQQAGARPEAVTAVFEDREGNVWTGTANSIERLRDSAFTTYSDAEGLPTGGNIPIFVDSEMRLWFPPASGGLHWSKDGKHGSIALDGLHRDIVYSIAGSGAELWVGRQRGGLTRLRTIDGITQATTYTQANGLAQNSVYSVHQGRDGAVWAGTLSGGVSRLQAGRFSTFTTRNGLASNTVASISEASNGTMWFATPNGLSEFAREEWRTYTTNHGLPSKNINCLLEDSSGALWVGTASGLAFRAGSKFVVPRGATPPLREQILGIAEDRLGFLWITTASHVLRVRRDKLARGTVTEADIREYGIADGLHGIEGVKRHRSVVSDPIGRIWLSMNRGISVVDPPRLASTSAPVFAHVQSIAADGTRIPLDGDLKIPPGRQRVMIGYTGLGLSVPERVRFRYWLDSFDKGWSEPVATREAIYTNLSPGQYRFRVVASNPEGQWNGSEASLAFEVEAAFWQTWAFRLSTLLACVLACVAIYRFRLHALTGKLNDRFEERLSERTRIARELHDTLLQGLLSASMQLHVADDRLAAGSPAKPLVGRVLELMRQVVDEGRTAVRGLRSPDAGSQDLEEAFSRMKEEFAPEDKVDYRVIVDGQRQTLHPVLRDEVYRIGREAVVNAFRHARANNIEVQLEYSKRQLRFLVRDDGCGIDRDVLKRGRENHWGLSGMRERAERIGVRLKLMSSPTAGTEVEICVPGHIAFESWAPERRLKFLKKLYRPKRGLERTRLGDRDER